MTDVIHEVARLRALSAEWHAQGLTVGLVPTMGALHEGHVSLVRAAQKACDKVVVSVFVNPRQFDNAEDLTRYPRTLDADCALLATEGVDAVFAPSVDEMYPAGFVTSINVGGVAEPLEGGMRPGHFDGVATVVTKLFGMSRADRAFFGQKDWQQLQVVQRLVADLNLPVEIVGCEILRDVDGLALSSRNSRLSDAGRDIAPALYRQMCRASYEINAGGPVGPALEQTSAALLKAGFERVEYIELRDAATLLPVTDPEAPRRLLAAVWLEGVRLIDNIPV